MISSSLSGSSSILYFQPFSINIFQTNTFHEQASIVSNDQFIYTQLLIDALFQLRPQITDKNKLVVICEEKYSKIHNELKLIREFEDDYVSEKAIYWYTKDSFIYRMLNEAIRTQDIELLFLFRFLFSFDV